MNSPTEDWSYRQLWKNILNNLSTKLGSRKLFFISLPIYLYASTYAHMYTFICMYVLSYISLWYYLLSVSLPANALCYRCHYCQCCCRPCCSCWWQITLSQCLLLSLPFLHSSISDLSFYSCCCCCCYCCVLYFSASLNRSVRAQWLFMHTFWWHSLAVSVRPLHFDSNWERDKRHLVSVLRTHYNA